MTPNPSRNATASGAPRLPLADLKLMLTTSAPRVTMRVLATMPA
jgi:hypothetical protein